MPKNSDAPDCSGRSNPYITTPISKSLLTPIRRVGLPKRKKTTPHDLNLSLDSPATTSTPPRVVPPEPHSDNVINGAIHKTAKSKRKEVQESTTIKETRCLTAPLADITTQAVPPKPELHSDNVSNSAPHNTAELKKMEFRESTTIKNTKCVKALPSPKTVTVVANTKLKESTPNKTKTRKIVKVSSKDSSSSQDSSSGQDSSSNQEGSSSQDSNKLETSAPNNSKRPSCNFDEIVPKSKLAKLESEQPKIHQQQEPTLAVIKPKKTYIKRSLSMKKSHSDDQFSRTESNDSIKGCSVTLMQLDTSSFDDGSAKVIQDFDLQRETELTDKFEEQVAQKRKLLEELKQAEIYQRLHNVSELKKLTLTWKHGCISALNDLLPLLQKHAEMDMETLLRNLKIPEHLVQLSHSGDFL